MTSWWALYNYLQFVVVVTGIYRHTRGRSQINRVTTFLLSQKCCETHVQYCRNSKIFRERTPDPRFNGKLKMEEGTGWVQDRWVRCMPIRRIFIRNPFLSLYPHLSSHFFFHCPTLPPTLLPLFPCSFPYFNGG